MNSTTERASLILPHPTLEESVFFLQWFFVQTFLFVIFTFKKDLRIVLKFRHEISGKITKKTVFIALTLTTIISQAPVSCTAGLYSKFGVRGEGTSSVSNDPSSVLSHPTPLGSVTPPPLSVRPTHARPRSDCASRPEVRVNNIGLLVFVTAQWFDLPLILRIYAF